MAQHPLTRRRFLASLSAGAVVALAACQRSGPTPTPAPDPTPEPTAVPPLPLLSVGVAGMNATLLPIAKGFSSFLGAAVQGYRVEFAEGTASAADITVTPAAPSDAGRELSKLTRVYAPVTHWRLPLHYVERAELTGGTFDLTSQPGAGTRLHLHIPYPGEDDRDPVCGMAVEPDAIGAEHAGKLYRFCSGACRDLFLAQPAQYTLPGDANSSTLR